MSANKITPETEVSTEELACVLGVTGRYIRQLAEDGVLERSGRGKFRLCDNVKRYVETVRKKPVDKDEAELNASKLAADVSYKEAKARVAQLEADELENKMHRSEDVAAMTEDLIYTIRAALVSLPGRLAMDAAAATTPAEVSEVIRKEVHLVMRELAGYQYDPQKYAERVRERQKWEAAGGEADDE